VLGGCVLAGVSKVVYDMYQWRIEQERDKAPWERAMDDFDANV
jgi:hypothetical protein